VFVRGAVRDELCEIFLTSQQARSCRGEIAHILEPSTYRIKPDCPVYPQCGGCDFRHITYEEELWAKFKRLNDALERIGGTTSVRASEILTTGKINNYRNKAVFHVRRNSSNTRLKNADDSGDFDITDIADIGFFRAGSHEICCVKSCLLLRDELNSELSKLWKKPPLSESEVTLRVGSGGTKEHVEEILDGITFKMSKTSFFQVNTEAALLLNQKAREFACLSKDEVLVDIYCGVGTLTIFLGRDCGRTVGVDVNKDSILDAKKNAKDGGFSNIDFVCADASDIDISPFRPDCIVVDPPRRGLSKTVVSNILKAKPKRVVYISCDPATLARDIKLLHGYELKSVCAVDMFPRTANVESCALLRRKNS
jgi:23S rRNA (uracil1939-C5)-methyltransferase